MGFRLKLQLSRGIQHLLHQHTDYALVRLARRIDRLRVGGGGGSGGHSRWSGYSRRGRILQRKGVDWGKFPWPISRTNHGSVNSHLKPRRIVITTHLSNIPSCPRVEENTARQLAVGATPGIHHANLPVTTLYQGCYPLTEIDFVRPSRQAVERNKHGPSVVGCNLGELLLAVIGCSWR